ncbi:MAG: hypothetical protein IPM02_15480 [Betaproteobacteria bacterium]|nr:hypothetical protein [Betaproteobacteria bacterium]
MKFGFRLGILIVGIVAVALPGMASRAATYDLSWNAIAGGGDTATTGGSYALGATIGQAGTGSSTGGSYSFKSGFWQVENTTPAEGPTIDIDGNNIYDALTDGLLIIRYLFGLSGLSLTNGAIGPGATRLTPQDILLRLNNIRPILDVDGNGQPDALTDGLMLIRYLFGLRGNSVTANAVGNGAQRMVPMQIEPYIQSLMP